MLWLEDGPRFGGNSPFSWEIGSSPRQLDWSQSFVRALVSAWPMDEGTGTVCYDAMGVNHGVLGGGAVRTVSQLGRSIKFSGTSQSVTVSAPKNVPIGTSERSISIDFVSPDTTICSFHIKTSSGQSFVINIGYVYGNYYIFTDAVNSANNSILPTQNIPLNNIKHSLLATFKNNKLWYYIDGSLIYSKTFDAVQYINTDAINSIVIGTYNGLANDNCTVNNVALFNKALTTEEAKQLYYNGLYIQNDDPYYLTTNRFKSWFVRPTSVWD
jgi:hypothetical protein